MSMLTEDEKRTIIRMYESGKSIKQIRDATKRSRDGIVLCLGKAGLHEPTVNQCAYRYGERLYDKDFQIHNKPYKDRVYWRDAPVELRAHYIAKGREQYLKECKIRYDALFETRYDIDSIIKKGTGADASSVDYQLRRIHQVESKLIVEYEDEHHDCTYNPDYVQGIRDAFSALRLRIRNEEDNK